MCVAVITITAGVKLWNMWHFWSCWPDIGVICRGSEKAGVSRFPCSALLWITGLLSTSRCECRSSQSAAWVKECHLLHIGRAWIPVYCRLVLADALTVNHRVYAKKEPRHLSARLMYWVRYTQNLCAKPMSLPLQCFMLLVYQYNQWKLRNW